MHRHSDTHSTEEYVSETEIKVLLVCLVISIPMVIDAVRRMQELAVMLK